MKDSTLDQVLTELSKNETDQVELTKDVLQSMGIEEHSPYHSSVIRFLEQEGHIQKEVIPYFEANGQSYPARYLVRLTPQGLKFIADGGYTSVKSYSKRTLKIATQSRNWAIIGVAIAVAAILL